MGRTIGRVCNRVAFGRFIFDGQEYQLPINNCPHTLHGGPQGIALKEWEVVRETPSSVTFRIYVNEATDGFPGDAKIDVTYTVNDMNQLLIEHGATCTTPGVLNLTNHSYWNLSGCVSVLLKNKTSFSRTAQTKLRSHLL
ncbi:aldose 1-epimerase [Cooperia oncophora]